MKKNYGYRVRSDREMIYDPLFEGDSIFDDEKQEAWEIANNKHWNKGGITLAANRWCSRSKWNQRFKWY